MQKLQAVELSHLFSKKEKHDFTNNDIETFQKLMSFHAKLYYNEDDPIIDDALYDALFSKLRDLEHKHDIHERFSSSVWVSLWQSSFLKVAHSRPMISLDNTYNAEDLRDFDTRLQKLLWYTKKEKLSYMLEYKFDGLGIELVYKKWILTQAITRWDGIEGEDVTQNILSISNIPKKINSLWDIEIRGEVLMPISHFLLLNEQLKSSWKKIFANPRNAASGSVRLKDANITAQRKLLFYAYDLWDITQAIDIQKSVLWKSSGNYDDVIHALEKLWFSISDYFPGFIWIEAVIEAIDDFSNNNKSFDFEIDGLVLKYNCIDYWQKIWYTAHHPRYAIAYKFPAQIATTKIVGVEHQVGRTGTITPVAHLKAVKLWWVVIERATLHNYDEIKKLDVSVWDTIFIKRAWEVIPKIISVAVHAQQEDSRILPPENCPSCQTQVCRDDDAVRYYCPNTYACPAQIQEKLIYAVGKNAFNIDGLGKAQIELFYALWYISHLHDIFLLHEKKQELLALPWYKEKSVSNLLSAIESAKKQDLWRFLVALSIPWVGKQAARELASVFHQKDDIVHFQYTHEYLTSLQDIWDKTADILIGFFADEKQKYVIERLFEHIEIIFPNTQKTLYAASPYFWKKICITGNFEWYSREQLIEELEIKWAIFSSSVSKNTDYLLCGEKAGSKKAKAQSLGIELLDIREIIW